MPPPAATPAASVAERFVFAPKSEATLAFLRDGVEERPVTLKRETRVGRHASNDLVIQDLHVSSHHARLVCRDDGVFEVFDLRSLHARINMHADGTHELHDLLSTCGTYVNGTQVQQSSMC